MSSASLFFGALTRLPNGLATMWGVAVVGGHLSTAPVWSCDSEESSIVAEESGSWDGAEGCFYPVRLYSVQIARVLDGRFGRTSVTMARHGP
jgi:hypothetical protein